MESVFINLEIVSQQRQKLVYLNTHMQEKISEFWRRYGFKISHDDYFIEAKPLLPNGNRDISRDWWEIPKKLVTSLCPKDSEKMVNYFPKKMFEGKKIGDVVEIKSEKCTIEFLLKNAGTKRLITPYFERR